MPRKRTNQTAEAGFTFVEMLVVIAVIGLMAIWLVPAFLGTLNRVRLTSVANETIVFLQKARVESIKRGTTTQVIFQNAATSDLGQPSIFAFADSDEDGSYNAATDIPLAGPFALPSRVSLWGPTDTNAEDTNAIVGWDDAAVPNNGPIFNTDGSVETLGAFRFRDSENNFLEVRIVFTGTAKPVIRKWEGGSDPNDNWYERGVSGHAWQW
jgi:prepilin-type N-terminal cleavage/methylation domain-containing protein